MKNEDFELNLEDYTVDNIQILKGLEGIRRRPGMYIRNIEKDDVCDDLVFETLCHAIDEFMDGNCTYLNIVVSPLEVTISYDAGVSLEQDIDGIAHVESIFTQLFGCRHTKKHCEVAAKYCGIGMVVVNAFSQKFQATTVCNGLKGEVTYQKGTRVGDFVVSSCNENNRTELQFIPDLEIFGDRQFHYANIETRAQELRVDFPDFRVTVTER